MREVVIVAMQRQVGSLAKKLGGRLSKMNEATSGKPLNIGQKKLPPGIKNGIAKVVMLDWKEQEKDGGKIPKGELYFFGRAVVMYPLELDGMSLDDCATVLNIPLCDVKANPATKRKASSAEENWDKYRSIIEMLGVGPCKETSQTDPTGIKTEAYFLAAMKMLVNNPKNPTYVKFTTSGIAGTPTKENPHPEPFVYEQWLGKATQEELDNLLGKFDPADGITQVHSNGSAANQLAPDGLSHTNAQAHIHSMSPDSNESEDEQMADIAGLVEFAMDENHEQCEGAREQLENMAKENGWTQEQIEEATDWEQVGDMAQGSPEAEEESEEEETTTSKYVVGSEWSYTKRSKNGEVITDKNGKPLAPIKVEIIAINEEDESCFLKDVKTGKPLNDMRTGKPLSVKFEWLE